MPFRALGGRLHRAAPRQEVDARQQSSFAQCRQNLARLWCQTLLWSLFLRGRPRHVSKALSRPLVASQRVVTPQDVYHVRRLLLIRAIVEAARPVTHTRQLRLAADVRETLNPPPIRIHRQPQLTVEIEIVLKRHGALVVEDQRYRPMNALDPLPQLVGVAHRRGETNQGNVLRRMDDRFLPDRSALRVAEIVQLIEDDTADGRELLV